MTTPGVGPVVSLTYRATRCAVGVWCVINFRFGARVPQSYELAEPGEVDSKSITQPAQTGIFP